MADKNGYTTIRIQQSVRDKISQIQEGTDLTVSDIINNLLQNRAGTITDDVENISRENVAYELEYADDFSAKIYYLTYREIAKATVGCKWYANSSITAEEYQTESAELLFKDSDSAIIRTVQTVVENNSERKFNAIVHISLF